MSDENSSSEDALLKKHRRERKELQAKITNLKHGVAKGDKKKKKEIMELTAKLSEEMNERHEQELSVHRNNTAPSNPVEEISDHLQSLSTVVDSQDQKSHRISRAQKRRDKKATKEKEREQRIVEQETENLVGARHLENEKLKKILKERCLAVHEVPSDGDCLYAAVAHQLFLQGLGVSVRSLRQQVASFMKQHKEDYLPFLGELENGEVYTTEKFEQLCNSIESTAVWGGQLEMRAISQIYQHPIEILQAEGPAIVIGEYETSPLILTYHRFAYGLGEHYNSVTAENIPRTEDGIF